MVVDTPSTTSTCTCADRIAALRAAVAAQAEHIAYLEAQLAKEKEPLPTVAHVVADLRSEALMIQQALGGCIDLGCTTHGQDVQRLRDIDRQVTRILDHFGEPDEPRPVR